MARCHQKLGTYLALNFWMFLLALYLGRLFSRTLSRVLTKFWKSSEVFGIEDANFGWISVKKY